MDFIIMKKFKIHPLFFMFLIFGILMGLFFEMINILFVLMIHEVGHLFFINLFKNKIIDFYLYPFGGVIVFEEKNEFIYKAFLINYGGIVFNLLFFAIFKIIDLNYLSSLNLYFALINFVPIYPLDGGRGLNLLISFFLPNRLSKLITYFTSIILSVVIGIWLFLNYNGLYLILYCIFFLKVNILAIKFINHEYQKFLLLKFLSPNDKLKTKETTLFTTNPIKNLYLGKNTVFNYKTFKVKEEVILSKHFKNKKRLN